LKSPEEKRTFGDKYSSMHYDIDSLYTCSSFVNQTTKIKIILKHWKLQESCWQ